jgi:hypothetical protein
MLLRLAATAAIILGSAAAAMAQNTFPIIGNVGIGTNNPRGALHILRPGMPPGSLPAAENGLLLGTEGPAGPKWVQSYGAPLALNPQGNDVGIGRSTPTHRLDIGGPARLRVNNSTNLLVTGEQDDAFVDLVKETRTTPAARIELEGFADQTRDEGEIAFFTRRASDSDLVERMRIGSDGSITVGTGGQVRVAGNEVRLLNPGFRLLRTLERKGACLRELGGGDFTLAECLSAAEYAPTIDTGTGAPEPGDLVSLVPGAANPLDDAHAPFVVAKAAHPCDPRLLGVVSAPEAGASGRRLAENYMPLSIYGYFPARVTLENGVIRRGDPITSSARPGYGMKATGTCRIVGYALEDADRAGLIQVFASLGNLPGVDIEALAARVEMLEARLAALEHVDGSVAKIGRGPQRGAGQSP